MGLIQVYQRSKFGKWLAAWNYNRRMRRAVRILNRCAPYFISQIGRNKYGTIYQVKDLNFNMKTNTFNPKMRKLSRGSQTNNQKAKPKR